MEGSSSSGFVAQFSIYAMNLNAGPYDLVISMKILLLVSITKEVFPCERDVRKRAIKVIKD